MQTIEKNDSVANKQTTGSPESGSQPNLLSLAGAPVELKASPSKEVKIIQTACDVASSLGASVVGATTFAIATTELRGRSVAVSLAAAGASGSATKFVLNGALQGVLLDKANRTSGHQDLAWGAVDGWAGVAGGLADKAASELVLRYLGEDALGSVSRGTAVQAGKDLVRDDALAAIKLGVSRGFMGGAAAGATWSLPRRIVQNEQQLKTRTLSGLGNIISQTTEDTLIGGVTGGLLSGAVSSIARSGELASQLASKLRPVKEITNVDVFSINDFHSNVDQLPKLKTKVDQLIDESHAKGRTAIFVVAGDPISGHVNFAFTRDGEVEYRALAEIGKKADATIIGIGNHEYDSPGGRFNPERFPGVIAPILKEYPNVHLVNTNLDFSNIPGYTELVKRSVTIPLRTAGGFDKLGITAVTTEEGAVGGIKYGSAVDHATQTIDELNAQGVKFIQLTTHVGANEDEELARQLVQRGKKVAITNGGHSHTPLPRLRFITGEQTMAERLKFWKDTPSIPNIQAGSSGRWISVNHLAMRPDGSTDRWLTKGLLQPIDESIPEDPAMRAFLDKNASEAKALRDIKYNARTKSNYSLRGVRTQETPLGNLLADAIFNGVKGNPEIAPQIVLANSGGIRNDIYAGRELTRQDLANVIMNAGRIEGERKELTFVNMTGQQLKGALEFSVKEMPRPEAPSTNDRIKALFGVAPAEKPYDPSGNFMQVSGMKYTFDLTKPDGDKIANMMVRDAKGNYVNIEPNEEYRIVTRFHPIDKWIKAGVFGNVTQDEAYAAMRYKPVEVSQVDFLADYIRDTTIDPRTFSPVSGRIINKSPRVTDLPLKLGMYTTAPAVLTDVDDQDAMPISHRGIPALE
ncbi:MAG TPA: 5'-nucleotidase C-terminal domain-containing protein [Planktothrix sp.]